MAELHQYSPGVLNWDDAGEIWESQLVRKTTPCHFYPPEFLPQAPLCFLDVLMMYSVSFWFEKARAGFLELSCWGKVLGWYGELNENGSRSLLDLNAWSRWWDCWKGLGVAALLKEVCHWLGGFKSPYNSDLDLALSVSLWISSELSATASTQCLPAALLAMVMFMEPP